MKNLNNEEKINIIYENLNPKYKNIWKSVFGLDGAQKKTFLEIAKIYKCTSSHIKKTIEIIEKEFEDKKFSHYYFAPSSRLKLYLGCESDKEFYELLDKLPQSNKEILCEYYGIGTPAKTIEQIVKDSSHCYLKIKQTIKSSINALKTRSFNLRELSLSDRLLKEVGLSSYEELAKETEKLLPEHQQLFNYFYGINGFEKLTYKELSEKLNLKTNTVNARVALIKKLIAEKKYFKSYFKPECYLQQLLKFESKEQLEEALNLLQTKEKEIFCSYFGTLGFEKQSLEDVAKKCSTTKRKVELIIRSVCEKLKSKTYSSRYFKTRTIHLKLKNDELKNDIDKMIDKLKPKFKELYCSYYGILGYQLQNVNKIHKSANISKQSLYTYIHDIDRAINTNNLMAFYFKPVPVLLKYLNFETETQLRDAINKLKPDFKYILTSSVGLDSEMPKTRGEIAKNLKISMSQVNYKLDKAIVALKSKSYSSKVFTEMTNLLAMTNSKNEEELMAKIEKLKAEPQYFLTKYIEEIKLGKSQKEIFEKYGVNTTYFAKCILKINRMELKNNRR